MKTMDMMHYEYYRLVLVVVIGYLISSKIIFDKINLTIPAVVDEVHHLPQGMTYCEGNFTYWDDKITTIPGLYLITTVLISPFFECTIYNLRLVNLLASAVNFLLLSSMLLFKYGAFSIRLDKVVLEALNLVILPPLYFFSHLYYTDTLSLTFLLAFTRLCFTNKAKILMFVCGMGSILMRQINIVWVAMLFGHKAFGVFIKSSRVYSNPYLNKLPEIDSSLIANEIVIFKLQKYYGIVDALIAVNHHLSADFVTYIRFLTRDDWLVLGTHSLLFASFIFFVVINGGILIGDSVANKLAINLPQLLYLLLFYGVFGLPHVLAKLMSTIKLVLQNKTRAILFSLLFAFIVHLNTIVHPNLLSDNRHYTYYIWMNWFGKYSYAPYTLIPIYVFLLFSLYDNLKALNCISFLLPYCLSTFVVLALRKTIEVRYFLVPYLIIRLRFANPSYLIVLSEFLWYLLLNGLTFYVFFTKELYWEEYEYAQRIIW